MELTEAEFLELKREHYATWRELQYLSNEEREKELRDIFPAMYNELGELKEKWWD